MCAWGHDVWLHRHSLSIDAQAVMLWVRMFHTKVKMYVVASPQNWEWCHWNIIGQCVGDIGSCIRHHWPQCWRGIRGRIHEREGLPGQGCMVTRFHILENKGYLGGSSHWVCQENSMNKRPSIELTIYPNCKPLGSRTLVLISSFVWVTIKRVYPTLQR